MFCIMAHIESEQKFCQKKISEVGLALDVHSLWKLCWCHW